MAPKCLQLDPIKPLRESSEPAQHLLCWTAELLTVLPCAKQCTDSGQRLAVYGLQQLESRIALVSEAICLVGGSREYHPCLLGQRQDWADTLPGWPSTHQALQAGNA